MTVPVANNQATAGGRRLIDPVCRRCGGLKRRYARKYRRCLGLSYHRACCCPQFDCTTTTQLTVTLAIDSSPCSGCHQHGKNTWSSTNREGDTYYNLIGYDGSYTIDLTTGGPDFCNYLGVFTTSGADRFDEVDYYQGDTCDPLDFDSVDFNNNLQIAVRMGSDGEVRWLICYTTPGSIFQHVVFCAEQSGKFLDETITDETVSPSSDPRSCDTDSLANLPFVLGSFVKIKTYQGGSATVSAV